MHIELRVQTVCERALHQEYYLQPQIVVEYLNSYMYRGLNASGFTVEGPWQTRSIVYLEVVRKLVDAGSC